MPLKFVARSVAVGMLSLALVAGGCESPYPRHASERYKMAVDEGYDVSGGEDPEVPENAFKDVLVDGTVAILIAPFVALAGAFNWLGGDRPVAAFRLMEDPYSPDNRRDGFNRMAKFGYLTNATFKARARQVAKLDADYTVRATAIRTSNRARDAQATGGFVNALGDKNEWVRLEAAKALANVPDASAAEPLMKLLNDKDESRDVRIAAADALKHDRTLPVVRALAAALNDREFGVAWQSRRSLRRLTHRDYGYDEAAWLAYFSGPEKPLG